MNVHVPPPLLEPDRGEIERFVSLLFSNVREGYISIRAFYPDEKPFKIEAVSVNAGLGPVCDAALDIARRAANERQDVVFCPPVAVFANADRGREVDLLAGTALSADCDKYPSRSRAELEAILGPATVVVESGGEWIDPETGEVENKLHLHWRLKTMAVGPALAALKRARALANAVVGGDTTNDPVSHPIRWPGSWHRKGTPRLCKIAETSDNEIDLDAVLPLLEAARKREQPKSSKADASGDAGESAPWDILVADIIAGKELHDSIMRLAAKMVRAGFNDGAAVNLIRAVAQQSAAKKARYLDWLARYNDIPRAVSTAREDPAEADAVGARVKTLGQFLGGFVKPDYLVEGLLLKHFCYSVTGATGAGKTAIALLLSLLVASRKKEKLGQHEIEHGRIVYIAAENPTDVQMRLIAMGALLGIPVEERDFLCIEQTGGLLSSHMPAVTQEIAAFGDVSLVIADTSPSLFEGDNENDNKQMIDHAKNLRRLCDLPGRPTALALCHPVKTPNGPDSLLPRGGGAFIAEVDGNFTAWKHDGNLCDLHWTGKLRGPDFEKITFRLEEVRCPELVDSKGRSLPTVIARGVSDAEAAASEEAAEAQEERLLAAILIRPSGTLEEWARACGWSSKYVAHRVIKRLETQKLVAKQGRRHVLSRAGKAAVRRVSEA